MTKQTGLDLSSLDTVAACDAGVEIQLRHPSSGEPLDVFITVAGKDSTAFRNNVKKELNRQLRQQASGKRIEEVKDADGIEAESCELLAACTISWRNVFYKGEVVPFSAANAKRLYLEQLWIRRQVDEAIGNMDLFIKA